MVDRLLAGENPIRVWREHRGMSASQLAERAGLSQAYVSQLETGRRDGTVAALGALARALGLDIDDLTGRSEEHTSELQSLMRISYAVFCLKKKKRKLS